MAVTAAQMKLIKSAIVLDGTTNGGVKGTTAVTSGVRHALFPRVTRAERTAGVTRYRKLFLANENPDQEAAYGPLVYLTYPSVAGDRFYLAAGTQTDTQATIVATPPEYTGCGQLAAPLAGGETEVELQMEANDFAFIQDGWLHISSHYKTGQTAGSGVLPGASVTFSGGAWQTAGHAGDYAYPNGIWLGSGVVMTDDGTGTEEWLKIADTATPYSYTGTTVTVQLADPVANAYATATTWGSGCIAGADLVPVIGATTPTTSAGTENNALPIVGDNKGTVAETITITFSSASAFSASGTVSGSLGTGSVSSAFAPVNPASGTPYFTIPANHFTGTWASSDTVVFATTPAAQPVWLKEVVPASTAASQNNVFGIGYYWE